MNAAPRPSQLTPSTFIKAMGALLALFNLLAAAFAVWMLVLSHRHQVERAETATHNLAQALEDNVGDTLHRIDLAIRSIQDGVVKDIRDRRLDAIVQTQFQRTGILHSLLVTDAEGAIVHRAPASAPMVSADPAFFLRLKKTPQADLMVSKPIKMPEGPWILLLARRISAPSGAFLGVAYAALPTEQLARTMSRLDVGRWGSVSLRGEDLSLLVRYPDFAGQQRMTGDTRLTGTYGEAVRLNRSAMQFTERSIIDGLLRTYTMRRTDYPRFYILVGLAQRDYLRVWRFQVVFVVATLLGLAALTVALGWQTRSSLVRQRKDQARLASEEAKYRLLADNALDVVWATDAKGNLTYISPSVHRQRGWTPAEFIALDLEKRVYSAQSQDRIQARIEEVRRLAPGSQPFEEDALEVGVRHRDGREILVEIRTRVVWSPDGQVLGLQGVTRDITERKRMETERDRLIQELTQALADVKRLSGLLPICSSCKKVRGDTGYWSQIEAYLAEHTDATFTHGLCPDCSASFRQEMQARRDQKADD